MHVKFRNAFFLFFLGIVSTVTVVGLAKDSESSTKRYTSLIPRYLLGLVHAPEVQRDLELTDEQIQNLELLFHEIDREWFPARILPVEEQQATVDILEQRVRDWFQANANAQQLSRLTQLEYYAQGSRILLRDDVRSQIGLDPTQQEQLATLARETDVTQQELSRTQFGDPAIKGLQLKFNNAYKAERAALTKILTTGQRQKLSQLLGPTFDTSKLSRIYAMAPEFGKVQNWINSKPLEMKNLLGKVVIIHFYAFECHNCHANFESYQRWHKDLTDKGVVVVGIQTPETDHERNPEAVRSAAINRGLQFPILIDLESANWKAWGNTMWPTVYVVDKKGYIRHWWQGELNWNGATEDKTIEQVVNDLLAEKS